VESKTKAEFSPETIARLVKSRFGSAARIGKIAPLTAGWFNTAYEIHFTDENPAAVLRIAPDPNQRVLTYEKEMMRKELIIYKTVYGAVDIPMPRLLGADTSRTLIERDFMFVEKFSGRPLDQIRAELSPEEMQSVERQIGAYTAAMHTLKNDTFGYFGDGPGHGLKTWREAFLAIVFTLLADGESLGADVYLPYPEMRELFRQHAATLDEIREPSLVHWDMWQGNIFVDRCEGEYFVEGIIDWERAFWGDPEAETAMCCKFYGPAFFEGYGRNLLAGDSAVIRQYMYRMFLWLIMIIEEKVRFEGADHIPWVREQLKTDSDFLLRM
jgi:aminoglycoside phosphotransferase (APT) family kinase protein